MNTSAEVRGELERRFGTAMPSRVWKELVHEGLVRDVTLGAMTIGELATKARRLMAIHRSGRATVAAPARNRLDGTGARLDALTVLLAADAVGDPEVARIRARIGRIIDWADVDAWITTQAAVDGPPTLWIECALPPGHRLVLGRGGYRVEPPLQVAYPDGHKQRTLAYVTPGGLAVQRVAVARTGLLEDIRAASERLALTYGWEEAQAATWLLTDIPPAYALMSAGVEFHSGPRVTERVILTIDPVTPARQVAAFYRSVTTTGNRTPSSKHSAMAAFAVSSNSPETWLARMHRWNKVHPGWKARAWRNFARDSRAAMRRLLRQD